MTAAGELLVAHQPEIRLVHQAVRLEGMSLPLAGQLPARDPTQPLVQHRQHLGQRVLITGTGSAEQGRDIPRLFSRHGGFALLTCPIVHAAPVAVRG